MTAATVLTYVETINPKEEVVTLSASDGTTFLSRKFNTIQAAHVTCNSGTATSGSIAATFSGTMATYHESGATNQNITLVLYGE